MKRALVTGAGGFIGSHLCRRLNGDGFQVTGVDSFTDYYDPAIKRARARLLIEEGVDLLEVDLIEGDLTPLVENADLVFHLAGQPGVRASWGTEFDIYARENVMATQRLLEVLKGSSIGKLVLASSSSVYGDAETFPTSETDLPQPVSPYGVTKLAAEHLGYLYWKAFDVPVVALRYFTIFGPGQRPDMAFTRFLKAAENGDPITIYGDGKQVRDFTYVGDCVAATVSAAVLGKPGTVYNIAGGTQASVLDVLEIIEELTGGAVDREYQEAMKGDARRTGADTNRAKRDLGYMPQVSLADGIRLQLEAHRQ